MLENNVWVLLLPSFFPSTKCQFGAVGNLLTWVCILSIFVVVGLRTESRALVEWSVSKTTSMLISTVPISDVPVLQFPVFVRSRSSPYRSSSGPIFFASVFGLFSVFFRDHKSLKKQCTRYNFVQLKKSCIFLSMIFAYTCTAPLSLIIRWSSGCGQNKFWSQR